jgi:TP901 family phage tail tape measure protein
MADQEKKLVFKLVGDNSSLKKSFNDTNKQTNSLGKTMKRVGTVMASAFAIKTVVKFSKAISDVGIQFESQMAKVKAISGATEEDFSKLEAEAKRLGKTTKFSAKQSAEGLEKFAMAGWDAQASINTLEPTLKLAQASSTDLGITADILSDAMTGFGMSSQQAGQFADLLASTTSSANTNVTMLGESFKYVSPLMGSVGASANHTSLALGLMANAGIKGSQAGTSLKSAVTNLLNPTKQMSESMKKVGLEVEYNNDGTLNLKGTMDNLRSSFQKLTPEQQAQAGATIFGKNAMAGMLAIVNATTEDYTKLTDATTNYNGVAQEQADIMGNTLEGRIQALKSAWEGVQLMLYEYLLPVFELVVSWLQKLVDGAMNLELNIKKYFKSIGGANKELSKWFLEMKDKILVIYENIRTAIFEWYEANKRNIDAVIEKFKYFWKGVQEVIKLVLDLLSIFIDVFTKYFLDYALNAIQKFIDVFSGIIDAIKGTLKVVKGIFTGDWALIWEGAMDIFKGIFGAITGIFRGIFNGIIRGINGAIRAINKIKVPDWVPKVGGRGIKLPTIPMLAEGGIVTKPTLAMIGEGNESEAVIPLSKLGNMTGGKTANIIVELDGMTIAQAIGEPLVEQIRVQTGMAI